MLGSVEYPFEMCSHEFKVRLTIGACVVFCGNVPSWEGAVRSIG